MESAPLHPPAAEASIQEAIARIGQLPVLDRALRRVRELAADPDSDTNELVARWRTAGLARPWTSEPAVKVSAPPLRSPTITST